VRFLTSNKLSEICARGGGFRRVAIFIQFKDKDQTAINE
jgi:hypothetical protein